MDSKPSPTSQESTNPSSSPHRNHHHATLTAFKPLAIDGDSEIARFTSVVAAALRLQRVYRGYRTRRRLADTAVVAEALWWQAIDYARLSHSTISFFDFAKPETPASRWSRVSLNASKVGKGLSKDAKALKLAFQHWIEAIDPRHRYGHNLHLYYDEWRKADSGQPFFYWLDIGDGREVDLKTCPRSKLRQQSIKYLGPQEREHYEYIIVAGKIVRKQTGDFLHTIEEEGIKWIYVVSTAKTVYIGKKKKGIFHHSSFLAGGTTLAAGRLVCEAGVLKSISAYSGHYRPTWENLDSFLSILKENEVNLDEVQIHRSDDSENYEDSISVQEENTKGGSIRGTKPSTLDIPNKFLKDQWLKMFESAQAETSNTNPGTSSDGLQSPRPAVPKNKILQRINTKKAASSYQLGHQLSFKWSTGSGTRIGCVADYPMELRVQALQFVNTPRNPPTSPSSPSSFQQLAGFGPYTPRSTSDPVMVV